MPGNGGRPAEVLSAVAAERTHIAASSRLCAPGLGIACTRARTGRAMAHAPSLYVCNSRQACTSHSRRRNQRGPGPRCCRRRDITRYRLAARAACLVACCPAFDAAKAALFQLLSATSTACWAVCCIATYKVEVAAIADCKARSEERRVGKECGGRWWRC